MQSYQPASFPSTSVAICEHRRPMVATVRRQAHFMSSEGSDANMACSDRMFSQAEVLGFEAFTTARCSRIASTFLGSFVSQEVELVELVL